MLGRYEIEKELGKGAMGVVYLGRDPKINRVVAIKTMALSQEFEADELVEVKERFFREAETAGRLNHANIVTMFDAGEEHDLAYIAMEFLKGKDLVPYAKPGNLLPLPRVMSIVARVADALSYAHENNVVHRDIKPANIMYEPESDQVKVTDFGIARITDSSKTKTGMVLGTPSFMSPEQLAGKEDRRPLRPVLARRHAVPDVLRQAALRGRFDGATNVQDRQRTASGHSRPQSRPAGLCCGNHRSGNDQGSGCALPDRCRICEGCSHLHGNEWWRCRG
jgi:serine/threonine protein kinase